MPKNHDVPDLNLTRLMVTKNFRSVQMKAFCLSQHLNLELTVEEPVSRR